MQSALIFTVPLVNVQLKYFLSCEVIAHKHINRFIIVTLRYYLTYIYIYIYIAKKSECGQSPIYGRETSHCAVCAEVDCMDSRVYFRYGDRAAKCNGRNDEIMLELTIYLCRCKPPSERSQWLQFNFF
jgi:hypothetical protein